MSNTRLAGLAAAVGMLLAAGPMARAGLVADDFSYTAGQLRLKGSAGGGWADGWGATTGTSTSKMLVDDATNLTTTVGGYNITQTGTGLAYGVYNASRGVNRYIDTDLGGTVWFSALLKNPASSDRAGIQFNNHADAPYGANDWEEGDFQVGIYGSDLRVKYGGTLSASAATVAVNQTHLVVGKMVLGAGNDSLEVWADPADVNSLGAPDFSRSDADMGDDLHLAGVYGYFWPGGGDHPAGQVDALRISDGDGDAGQAFIDVVGPPAPPPPPPTELRFQEGVSPTSAYLADSTHIRSDRATSPQDDDPGDENIIGRVGSSAMRGMFEFDLSEIEAQGRTPTGVQLVMTTLGTDDGQGPDPLTVDLYQYGFDFVEGSATWNDPDGDGNPATGDTTPGGTFGSALTAASFNPVPRDQVITFGDTAAFLDAVNAALASPDNTLRLIARASSESGSGNHFVRFLDETIAAPQGRPELIVTLAPVSVIPEPATMCAVGLALAGLGGYVKRRKRS